MPYWKNNRFDITRLTGEECKADFRFGRDEFINDISHSALCSSTMDDPDLSCLLFDKCLIRLLLLALVFHGLSKAERRWRMSSSTTDLLSLNKACCAYKTNFVSKNCLNQRKLLSTCKSLLNLLKCASLPLHSNSSQLANDFGKFFCVKINSIWLGIACQCCSSGVSDSHLELYGLSFV